jgi:hypothetical protein
MRGQCPECGRQDLAYTAPACTICGHTFRPYSSFGEYLQAEEERARRDAEIARLQQWQFIGTMLKLLPYVLFAGLVLLGGVFLLLHNLPSSNSEGPNPSNITSSLSPGESATATVQQYYNDINSKNYQAAYKLWDPQSASLQAFTDGYRATLHDDLTLGQVVPLADGTQKVSVTIVATEQTASGGTRKSTYKGYYIVKQHGNTWKFLDGTLSLV